MRVLLDFTKHQRARGSVYLVVLEHGQIFLEVILNLYVLVATEASIQQQKEVPHWLVATSVHQGKHHNWLVPIILKHAQIAMQEKHQKQHRLSARIVAKVDIKIRLEVLVVFRVFRDNFKTTKVVNSANHVKSILFHGIQQEKHVSCVFMDEHLKLEVLRVQRAELVEKK